MSQLLKTHPELMNECDDYGLTILHSWIGIGRLWPFKYMIERDDVKPKWKSNFIELLNRVDKDVKTPLHLAASSSSKDMVDIVMLLLDASHRTSIFRPLRCEKDSELSLIHI